MADEPDKDQKTEAPTQKRRDDARRKGDLFTSRELANAMVGVAGAGWAALFAPGLAAGMAESARRGFSVQRGMLEHFEPVAALATVAAPVALPLAALAAMVLGAVVAGQWLTGGIVFAPSLLAPKLNRMSPVKGLGRMLGKKSLVELLKALAKAVLLIGVSAIVLWRAAPGLIGLPNLPLDVAMRHVAGIGVGLFFALAIGLMLIAAGDVPFQFFEWLTRQRMTRQELKDEFKQAEGSPEVKGALRRAQREAMKRASGPAVASASVVLTNPTHFAVALRYDPMRDMAPVVVARGRGLMADVIRELAEREQVPMMAYPAVARALYYTGRVGLGIRDDLYPAIATILAFVARLNADEAARRPGAWGRPPPPPPHVEPPSGLSFDEDGRRLS